MSELITPTGVLVTDAEPETPSWYAARAAGITGTDLPKILGYSRYGNALSCWMQKRGELDDEAGEAARWGQVLEDPVAQVWAAENGLTVRRVGVLQHAECFWMRASLDRRVDGCPDGPCGLEVKTRSAYVADRWRDGVPDDVLAQVLWGLRVTGLHHMHVAALIGGQRLASFRVERDDVIEQYLVDAAAPVWQAVQEGTPPETHPDADGVLLDLLDRLYSSRAGDRELDPEKAEPWLEQYAAGNDLEREGKRLKTEAKTGLVQLLDDGDTGLIDDVPVFTYRRPAPGVQMTAAAIRELEAAQPDVYQSLVDEGFITATNPGPRFDLKKRATRKDDAA
jgi:putative phage-type endonuclease